MYPAPGHARALFQLSRGLVSITRIKVRIDGGCAQSPSLPPSSPRNRISLGFFSVPSQKFSQVRLDCWKDLCRIWRGAGLFPSCSGGVHSPVIFWMYAIPTCMRAHFNFRPHRPPDRPGAWARPPPRPLRAPPPMEAPARQAPLRFLLVPRLPSGPPPGVSTWIREVLIKAETPDCGVGTPNIRGCVILPGQPVFLIAFRFRNALVLTF